MKEYGPDMKLTIGGWIGRDIIVAGRLSRADDAARAGPFKLGIG